MKQLAIDVSDDAMRQLEDAADRLGVTPTELAAAAVRDLLAHPEADIEEAASRVIERNYELYRRLA